MGEVVTLNMITSIDIPADRVIDAAKDAGLTKVVIVGYDADGQEYFASSVADGGSVLWLMERAKHKLMEIADHG